jgi:hypothetical protein
MISSKMQTVALALTFTALCVAVAGSLYICHLQDGIAASGNPAEVSRADAEVPTACPVDAARAPQAVDEVSPAAEGRVATSEQSPS